MTTYRGWLSLLLLATSAWGQAAKPAARPTSPQAAAASSATADSAAAAYYNVVWSDVLADTFGLALGGEDIRSALAVLMRTGQRGAGHQAFS